ncbi:MAG: hypothetical protein WCD18_22970 [Thermosynechococcaceae cyanobacterium]
MNIRQSWVDWGDRSSLNSRDRPYNFSSQRSPLSQTTHPQSPLSSPLQSPFPKQPTLDRPFPLSPKYDHIERLVIELTETHG